MEQWLGRALLIGTASGDAAAYAKRGYDEAMRVQLLARAGLLGEGFSS